jgi:hypothetical protein
MNPRRSASLPGMLARSLSPRKIGGNLFPGFWQISSKSRHAELVSASLFLLKTLKRVQGDM